MIDDALLKVEWNVEEKALTLFLKDF